MAGERRSVDGAEGARIVLGQGGSRNHLSRGPHRPPDMMDPDVNCRLAGALANRIRDAREELTRRWLDRIAARVEIDPNRVFPTDELLDHVPLLMDRIAD